MGLGYFSSNKTEVLVEMKADNEERFYFFSITMSPGLPGPAQNQDRVGELKLTEHL